MMVFSGQPCTAQDPVRYVPIGDSYTAGTGVSPEQAWPVLLTQRLRAAGIDIEMIGNPAQNGWTTVDALEKEMPLFRAAQPGFATLMVGANDLVQGADTKTFRKNFSRLLDAMLAAMPGKKRLVVITIPDFTCTLSGSRFTGGRDVGRVLGWFNRIIREEAGLRGLPVADIYPVSRRMCKDYSYTAPDGLHPSIKGHYVFQEVIYAKASLVFP